MALGSPAERSPTSTLPRTRPLMTIFSKILAGEIPCHRVHEDDHVLAFLDIGPLARGHVLLIPKEEKATLGELSPR